MKLRERLTTLFLALLLFGLAGLITWWQFDTYDRLRALSTRGVIAQGTVQGYRHKIGSTYLSVHVKGRKFRVHTSEISKPGSQVALIIDPKDASNAALYQGHTSVAKLFIEEFGVFSIGLIVFAVMQVISAVGGIAIAVFALRPHLENGQKTNELFDRQ